MKTFLKRAQLELEYVKKHDSKTFAAGETVYIVEAAWIKKWKAFLQTEDAPYPGPVDNASLIEAWSLRCPMMHPLPGLVRGRDYRGVNGKVWSLFVRTYGGGPEIVRRSVDIYEVDRSPRPGTPSGESGAIFEEFSTPARSEVDDPVDPPAEAGDDFEEVVASACSAASPEETAEARLECVVCREDFSAEDFGPAVTARCGHARDVCGGCMAQFIRTEVYDKGNVATIVCPHVGCGSQLAHADVQREAAAEVFRRFDDLLIRRQLDEDPLFCWCAHGCGSGQVLDGAATRNTFMTCEQCRRRTCAFHRCEWHEGQTCAQFDGEAPVDDFEGVDGGPAGAAGGPGPRAAGRLRTRAARLCAQAARLGAAASRTAARAARFCAAAARPACVRAARARDEVTAPRPKHAMSQAALRKYMKEQGMVECPKCRHGIQKSHGCDHMTCRCGHEFCFICGAIHPTHKSSCKYSR